MSRETHVRKLTEITHKRKSRGAAKLAYLGRAISLGKARAGVPKLACFPVIHRRVGICQFRLAKHIMVIAAMCQIGLGGANQAGLGTRNRINEQTPLHRLCHRTPRAQIGRYNPGMHNKHIETRITPLQFARGHAANNALLWGAPKARP